MLYDNSIKEAISIRFIELIAAYNGYKTSCFYPDNGTDLSIIEVGVRNESGNNRYYDTGRELKLQLKSTTMNSIREDNRFIYYDLEIKTYNDLIERKNNAYPLILILFVLPNEKEKWINISDEELITRKCAYWFYPGIDDVSTSNKSKKRINIPQNNRITFDTFNQIFERFLS